MFFNRIPHPPKLHKISSQQPLSPIQIYQQSHELQNNISSQQRSINERYKINVNKQINKKQLIPEQLGDHVLEFTQKYHYNKLKIRHKRYVTMDIQSEEKNISHQGAYQQSKKCYHKLDKGLGKWKNGAYFKVVTALELQRKLKMNNQKSQLVKKNNCLINLSKMLKKNKYLTKNIDQVVQKQFIEQQTRQSPRNDTIFGQSSGERQRFHSNVFQNNQKYIYQQEQSISQIKAKPFKIVDQKQKNYQFRNSLFEAIAQINNKGEDNQQKCCHVLGFKKTKKRKNSTIGITNNCNESSNFQKNKFIEDQYYKQKIIPQDSLYYKKVPLKQTSNVVHNKLNGGKFPTSPIRFHNRRFSMDNEQHYLLNHHNLIKQQQSHFSQQQSVQEHSETSSQSSLNTQFSDCDNQALQTRVGILKAVHPSLSPKKLHLPKKIKLHRNKVHNHHKTYTTNIYKIQNINNQLDLGMKIIDDSFEISNFDCNHYDTTCDHNNTFGSPDISTITINQYCSPHVLCQNQEVIIEESVISPQCQQLITKLNQMLGNNTKLNSKKQSDQLGERQPNFNDGQHGEHDNLDINMQQYLEQQKIQQKLPLVNIQNNVKQSIPQPNNNLQYFHNKDEYTINSNNKNTIKQNNKFIKSKYQVNKQFVNTQNYKQQHINIANYLQLKKQNLQIHQDTGLILHKSIFIIKNNYHNNNAILTNIHSTLHNLTNFSINNHIYLKIYTYGIKNNIITLYKQPILLPNSIYNKIYNIKNIFNNANDTKINIDDNSLRNVIKQLLSVVCSHLNQDKSTLIQYQHLKLHMQDIYLCSYQQSNNKNINIVNYDIKIDKTKTIFCQFPPNNKRKDMNLISILRQNLIIVLDIINLLAKINVNNSNTINNKCIKKMHKDFVQLLENTVKHNNHHKINIQKILTHPYIWAQLPSNKNNSNISFNYQQLSILF